MSKADMKARHELSLSAALLLVGGAIYVLFRPLTLLMFRVADHLGLTPAIEAPIADSMATFSLGDHSA